jgi:hypothetical protein
MYRDTGAGKEPNPPAMMAMALLLQSYVGASDAEAVELTVVDLRWQMVLGRLGESRPAFSQGALAAFRERLMAHDMDRRLLERTVELAKQTKEFDWRKLPKHLHLAIDSSPLGGAGRVEDTINLLGHAARKVVDRRPSDPACSPARPIPIAAFPEWAMVLAEADDALHPSRRSFPLTLLLPSGSAAGTAPGRLGRNVGFGRGLAIHPC